MVSVAVGYADDQVVMASSEGTIAVFEPSLHTSFIMGRHEPGHICMFMNQEKQQLYTGGPSGTIKVWDFAKKTKLCSFYGHQRGI